jgi:hypothetical protein
MKNIGSSSEIIVYQAKTGAFLEQVRMEGHRRVQKSVEIYNLDTVISVGYRISSTAGTKFRQWATTTLRGHIADGFTLNKKRIANNYNEFLHAVEKVKKLLPSKDNLEAENALELIKMFAITWFSLDAYDKSDFTTKRASNQALSMFMSYIY